MAMLIAAACDTSKNSMTTAATPPAPESPAIPQKNMLKESDMKPIQVVPHEKKASHKKGHMLPMESPVSLDTIKH